MKNKIPSMDGAPFAPVFDEEHERSGLENTVPARTARITSIFLAIAATYQAHAPGFRTSDFHILNVLGPDDRLSIAEIARRARVDKGWISRLVRDQESKGYLKRERDPTDSRTILVSLSDRGREIQRLLLPMALENEKEALSDIDRAEFIATLEQLEKNSMKLLARLEQELRDS